MVSCVTSFLCQSSIAGFTPDSTVISTNSFYGHPGGKRGNMKKVVVRCSNLTKSFGKALAVNSVCLKVEKGSLLAVLGPSGCGKTTLLRLIAGLDTPDKGIIEVDGRMVAGPGIFVPPEKRKVGIVFQDYAMFPHLNVSSNIAYGLSRGAERKERIQCMLSLVGLKGSDSKMPHELSGGE